MTSRVPLRIVVTLAALFGAYLGFCLVQVWWVGADDQAQPVEAIVVMGVAQYDGRPSPQLQARLDHVITLWNGGIAPLVVTTGGNQPGDRFTEAEASRRYLVEAGVPESAIVLEDRGSSTLQSLQRVHDILAERGIAEVLIVTDPYHAARSQLIARDLGLVARVSATPTSVVTGGENLRRHVEEGLGVALANFIGFHALERLTN
ncbi:MAG: YdcF family protein [Ilumatobacteraceae bacterium]